MKSNSLGFLAFLDLKQIREILEDGERILSTGQTNRHLLFRLALLLVLLLPLVVDVTGLPHVELGREENKKKGRGDLYSIHDNSLFLYWKSSFLSFRIEQKKLSKKL